MKKHIYERNMKAFYRRTKNQRLHQHKLAKKWKFPTPSTISNCFENHNKYQLNHAAHKMFEKNLALYIIKSY
jgi:hypothetical protein